MYLLTKINFNKEFFFNLSLAAIPLSFIAGNMIININIVLFILFAIFFFKKELFNLKFYILDKLIFSYFILILLTAFLNDFYFFTEKMAWKGYFSTIIKAVLFLKYFFYIVLIFIMKKYN